MIASTRKFDCEYSRVLASSIASVREYDCDYSIIRLRVHVLASILEFSARKFRLACGQCIARTHSRLALAWDIASDTSHLHTCAYTNNFLWRCEKSLRSAIQNAVGRVSRNRDFFGEV